MILIIIIITSHMTTIKTPRMRSGPPSQSDWVNWTEPTQENQGGVSKRLVIIEHGRVFKTFFCSPHVERKVSRVVMHRRWQTKDLLRNESNKVVDLYWSIASLWNGTKTSFSQRFDNLSKENDIALLKLAGGPVKLQVRVEGPGILESSQWLAGYPPIYMTRWWDGILKAKTEKWITLISPQILPKYPLLNIPQIQSILLHPDAHIADMPSTISTPLRWV